MSLHGALRDAGRSRVSFAARRAALAFVEQRGGSPRARRIGWQSIALHWRRAKRLATPMRVRPSQLAVAPRWHAHVHLHMSVAQAATPAQRHAMAAAAGMCELPRRSVVRGSLGTYPERALLRLDHATVRPGTRRSHNSTSPPMHFQRVDGNAAPRNAGPRTAEPRFATLTPPTFVATSWRAAQVVASATKLRRMPYLAGAPDSVARTSAPTTSATTFRKTAVSTLPDRGTSILAPTIATQQRLTELIWRKPVVQAHGEVPAAEPITLRDGSSAAAATSALAPLQPVPTALQALSRTGVDTRVPALDAALADRLAEDVIRRVERRMRIERERRGV